MFSSVFWLDQRLEEQLDQQLEEQSDQQLAERLELRLEECLVPRLVKRLVQSLAASMAQQNLQRLIQHRELVCQLSPTALASSTATTTPDPEEDRPPGYLWMDPKEAKTDRATDITAESRIAGTDDHTNRT